MADVEQLSLNEKQASNNVLNPLRLPSQDAKEHAVAQPSVIAESFDDSNLVRSQRPFVSDRIVTDFKLTKSTTSRFPGPAQMIHIIQRTGLAGANGPLP